MKRLIAMVVLATLLCGCSHEVQITDGSVATRTGTVTDAAMASEGTGKIWNKSYPYLTVEFEDGTVVCIWNKNDIDDSGIKTGDTVEVTYGLQKNTDHWILIDIKEGK